MLKAPLCGVCGKEMHTAVFGWSSCLDCEAEHGVGDDEEYDDDDDEEEYSSYGCLE